MTMLTEVGIYVASNVPSLTLGTNLFLGELPDEPDTAVALHALPGGRPEYTMGAQDDIPQHPEFEHHRLQIEVRGPAGATAYVDAETLAWTIYRKMALTNANLQGIRYLLIEPTAIPAPLDLDKQDRYTFVINLNILREPESAVTQ
jgi:hypothetical protein